ncbi:MAG: hypothetical protein Q9226_008988 [Calogaya cf. arnoldii]
MAPPIPARYTVNKMTLKCTIEGGDVMQEESWQQLNDVKGSIKSDNVGPVVFEYGLSVTQDAGKGVSCTVTWGPGQLKGAPTVLPPQKQGTPIRIEVQGDPSQANQLPLAKNSSFLLIVKLNDVVTVVLPQGPYGEEEDDVYTFGRCKNFAGADLDKALTNIENYVYYALCMFPHRPACSMLTGQNKLARAMYESTWDEGILMPRVDQDDDEDEDDDDE